MAGNAAKDAAENLRNEIAQTISKNSGVPVDELIFKHGRIISNDKTIDLAWTDAIEQLTAKRGAVSVSGKYISPKLGGNFKGFKIGSNRIGACDKRRAIGERVSRIGINGCSVAFHFPARRNFNFVPSGHLIFAGIKIERAVFRVGFEVKLPFAI